MSDVEEKKTKTSIAVDFVEASKELLSSAQFFESIEVYTGSLSPKVAEEIGTWKGSGVIPPEAAAEIFPLGTIADLAPRAGSIGILLSAKPELEAKFSEIYEETKKDLTQEDLFSRVADYQDAVAHLASSFKTVDAALSSVSEANESWAESLKASFAWIKESVIASIGRVYRAFGGICDQVSAKIDSIANTLSGWKEELRSELIKKIRGLLRELLSLFNTLVSSLFGWFSRLRAIAIEKGFRLSKVTITIDPLNMTTVNLFGFPIIVPEIKLPRIELEFI